MNRRDFVKAAAAVAVAPSILLAEAPYQVFWLDECDFIAARSAEEAKVWYRDWTGVETEEAEPQSLETPFRMGDGSDEDQRRLTFREYIEEEVAKGATGPFYVATDGHYC